MADKARTQLSVGESENRDSPSQPSTSFVVVCFPSFPDNLTDADQSNTGESIKVKPQVNKTALAVIWGWGRSFFFNNLHRVLCCYLGKNFYPYSRIE